MIIIKTKVKVQFGTLFCKIQKKDNKPKDKTYFLLVIEATAKYHIRVYLSYVYKCYVRRYQYICIGSTASHVVF